MAEMGLDTFKANLSNPARVYLWEMLIINPVGGGDGDVLSIRCRSTSVPGKSFGNIDIPFKQTAGIRVHGKETYSHEITLEFIEGEDRKVFDAIHAWHQQTIHNRTGKGLSDDELKRDMVLNLVKTSGEDWMNLKLMGCYPQAVPDVPLNYETEGEFRYSVTFAYDRWEQM